MLNVGDTIDIGGREATICYLTQYNGKNYACLAFEIPNPMYKIYDYKYEGEKLLVKEVTNKDEELFVLNIFVKEGLEEYGLPPELEEAMANLPDEDEE